MPGQLLLGIPAPEQRVRDCPHQLSGGMQQRVMIAVADGSHLQIGNFDKPINQR